jgi:predicted metalloendopeptidase
VKIKKGTFFENYFSYVKYLVDKEFSSLGELVDKEEWGMTPQVRVPQ